MRVSGFNLDGVEVVQLPVERAPAIRVRYRAENGRWTTALLVIDCPLCHSPHRHAADSTLGDVVTAKCDRKASYRLAYAGCAA